MLDINFSLNLQDIERDLKQMRVQNIKESKILEQNCKAKVIIILSYGVILNSSLGGPHLVIWVAYRILPPTILWNCLIL